MRLPLRKMWGRLEGELLVLLRSHKPKVEITQAQVNELLDALDVAHFHTMRVTGVWRVELRLKMWWRRVSRRIGGLGRPTTPT